LCAKSWQKSRFARLLPGKLEAISGRKKDESRVNPFLFVSIPAVNHLVKTIQIRKEGIHAAAILDESNGPLEGMNVQVKLLKRRAYDYRNRVHFMRRVQLETGSTSVQDNLW